jgi:hypothetical protein
MRLSPYTSRLAAAVPVAIAALLLSSCSSTHTAAAPTTSATAAGTAVSAAAVAAVSAPAAAGSAGAFGAGNASTDCSYISSAQLSTIEGAHYGKPSVDFGICTWAGSDGNAVDIQLTRNASAVDWQSTLATIQSDQSAGAPAAIARLGDRAAGVGQEIAVQKGSTIVDIRSADSPGFGKWPKSEAIARAILSALH